jgi:phosphoglycolate phosphatase
MTGYERNRYMRIKVGTLLFDLDGTLVDSWPAMHQGVLHTLKKMNLPPKSFDEVLAFGPKGMIDLWQLVLQSKEQAVVSRAIEIYKQAFCDRLYKEVVAFPGVPEMLEYYRDKTKIVVTNGLADLSWKILKHAKLDRYIDDLVGGDDIGCVKPTACPLDKGMDRFGGGQRDALMIGDMVVDVAAGKAAGVYTCAVTYGIGTPEELQAAEPDYLIGDIAELKTIVAV